MPDYTPPTGRSLAVFVSAHIACGILPWLLLLREALVSDPRLILGMAIALCLPACLFAGGIAVYQLAHRSRLRIAILLVDFSFPLYFLVRALGSGVWG